jgi:hypothetical protein
MEFSQILAQKMQENESRKTASQEAKTASNYNILQFEPGFSQKPYLFSPSQIPYEKGRIPETKEHVISTETMAPEEPQIEVKNLDSRGQISLEIFMKLGAKELQKEHFSPSELKKSFRKLAKKHHPDLSDQGDSEKFQQLKMAYDTLKEAA